MGEPKQIAVTVPENLGMWVKRALVGLAGSGLLGGGGLGAIKAKEAGDEYLARLERLEAQHDKHTQAHQEILLAIVNVASGGGPAGPSQGDGE